MIRKTLLFIAATLIGINAQSQIIDIKHTETFSPYIFGHNLEHTRAAVNGGLSAQMLKNRKFAGEPSRNEGIVSKWFGIGDNAFFTMECARTYTRHTHLFNMVRWNEIGTQAIQNLKGGEIAGIGQYGLSVEKGREYTLRTVTQVNAPVELHITVTNRKGNKVYAKHTLKLTPSKEPWTINEFKLKSSANDSDAVISYTFKEQTMLRFGALSMMPSDNFHGMRKDVVANLKAIGPAILRWPGGNFAGEYRWKDGLLPVDERAPLGAYKEIETQPYSDGFDFHEIGTDEFIALCREVGAEPMITINASWLTPAECAEWVEYCNGGADTKYGKIRSERGYKEPFNVKFWSLGNEMGYSHMEGPKGPEGYSAMVGAHADAMLKVTPDLELCSSGPYPNDKWAQNSAAVLSDRAPYVSLHNYSNFYDNNMGRLRFTTPDEIKATYERITSSFKANVDLAHRMRECLDKTGKKMHISFDEWNQWFAWYRPSCVSEGIYTASMLHFFLTESNSLDIPIVCYFQPVGEGAIMIKPTTSRLSANGQMFALMKEHKGGALCKVSQNDDFSTVATIKDGILTITLINSAYESARTFDFALEGDLIDAKLYSSDAVIPDTYFEESKLDVQVEQGRVVAKLPSHSVAVIKLVIK